MIPSAPASDHMIGRMRCAHTRCSGEEQTLSPPLSQPSTPSRSLQAGAGWMALLIGLSCLGACSPPASDANNLLTIERLAFVPAGAHNLWQVGIVAGGGDPEGGDGLLVDLFEVTWREWLAAGMDVPLGGWDQWAGTQGAQGHLPAVGMDRAEALEFARLEQMRLPTVAEWFWCASGSRGQPHPYGPRGMASAANTLEVGLGRSVAVGTFASGRTPGSQLLDLEGNVWEWCLDQPPEGVALLGGGEGHLACAVGGSFLETTQSLHGEQGILARGLDPRHRAVDLGLRRVCSARRWLLEHGDDISDPRFEARVRGVGKRWGRPAVEMLRGLEEAASGTLGFTWLREGAEQ